MISSIAIVGMACVYADARTPAELWENVLAQRRAFRRIPAQRLNLEDYASPDRDAPDRTYGTQAAVIDSYEFDRVRFRVAGSTYRATDLTHWLALDVATQALADAGFADGQRLPRATTGVVVGNTLTGEFSRAGLMRLRWPYVRRVVSQSLLDEGWTLEQLQPYLHGLEAQYKEPFPAIGAESLAGGLSNTIAGRICNHLDLKGGGYTVDGACASSLLAITNACSALLSGDLDAALAGGVDLSLDPFELVGFAKTGALAAEEMRVFDARSDGFWPGEGCGFVVLMREEDAVAQGLRIYATIRGWGVSSDGSGGITRPEVDGQILAVERAYRRAGFGINTVAYFEGHGTGTAVGDATELRMLSRARRESDAAGGGLRHPQAPPAAIGSVKANIGHTKAAAGIAGIIKATLALHNQVLPPTTASQKVHPELDGPSPALRVLAQAQAWPDGMPLRVGVSAMGFGGINTHIVLEGVEPERRPSLGARTHMLSASAQDAELFLLASGDRAGLQRQVQHLLSFASEISRSELADLAAALEKALARGQARAAIVAATPAKLHDGLETLLSWLDNGEANRQDLSKGLFLGSGDSNRRIGFLFPGQGAPVTVHGGILARRFDTAGDLYRQAELATGEDTVLTSIAQPAVVAASLAALRVLNLLGIEAQSAIGHSLGELSALHWAGAMDEQTVLAIANRRGRLMTELGHPAGAMAQIGAGLQPVQALRNGTPVTIACVNSPTQTVISGESDAVDAMVARAHERGLSAAKISVSHAFHSPLMNPVEEPLADYLAGCHFHPLQRPVASTITGARLRADEDMPALLCRQITSPVRFTEALDSIARDIDLFIEVGPGQILSGLVRESADVPVIAVDAGGPSLKGLLHAAGAAHALGVHLNHSALFSRRFVRPFDLNWEPKFFVNPCEAAPASGRDLLPANLLPLPVLPSVESDRDLHPVTDLTESERGDGDTLGLVRRLVAERAELPLSAIGDDDHLLSKLHLNSITVGQLVTEAARALGLAPPLAPTEYADVTVATVAQSLHDLALTGDAGLAPDTGRLSPGVDSWVRPFVVDFVERRLPEPIPVAQSPTTASNWSVIGEAENPLVSQLQERLLDIPGNGVVVCCPASPDEVCLGLLLEAVRMVFEKGKQSHFVLVQHGEGATALAKTLHLERPDINVCVVDVPAGHLQAVPWILREVNAASGYTEAFFQETLFQEALYREAHYDDEGRRYEPVLRLLPLGAEAGDLPLQAGDVLLVTGGGKGITAECALSLARTYDLRLVLLGRSRADADDELGENLERMRAAGVNFLYISADITDAGSVRSAVDEAEGALGPIRGILHGAARNQPQLLHALDEEAFRRTLAPKTVGMRNLLAAIDPGQLRLFVAFGSIIAQAGLPGEADYALANQWLACQVADLQRRYPQCRCLTLEWSVWSGAGMGDRLGRLDTLVRQGIAPIPLEQGVDMLHRLLTDRSLAESAPRVNSIVVTGRFGNPPTLIMQKPEIPFWRFLEEVQLFYPGVELIVDCTLSVDTDPYLADHVYRNEQLLPAVVGLEAMAQTAMALAATDQAPLFEDVHFYRPVVVAPHGTTKVRLAALVQGAGRIEVVLRSEETAFQADHFRAICCFDQDAQPLGSSVPAAELAPVSLDVDSELYGHLLFQTGRFQRLQTYRHLAAKSCVAEIRPQSWAEARGMAKNWFGRYLPSDLVLGDPGRRDATLHAVQVCVPHATLLPIGVEKLVVETEQAAGALIVHAQERSRDGDTYTYDVDVTDASGKIVERWTGLRFRLVAGSGFDGPWPAALLGPYLERLADELLEDAHLSIAVVEAPTLARQERSNLAIQRALGQPLPIQRRPDGKPEVAGKLCVSAAHAMDLTLAVAGPGPVGCDVEPVVSRSQQVWQDLLGMERYKLAQVLAAGRNEELATAATRVWAASECLRKAGAPVGCAPRAGRG